MGPREEAKVAQLTSQLHDSVSAFNEACRNLVEMQLRVDVDLHSVATLSSPERQQLSVAVFKRVDS